MNSAALDSTNTAEVLPRARLCRRILPTSAGHQEFDLDVAFSRVILLTGAPTTAGACRRRQNCAGRCDAPRPRQSVLYRGDVILLRALGQASLHGDLDRSADGANSASPRISPGQSRASAAPEHRCCINADIAQCGFLPGAGLDGAGNGVMGSKTGKSPMTCAGRRTGRGGSNRSPSWPCVALPGLGHFPIRGVGIAESVSGALTRVKFRGGLIAASLCFLLNLSARLCGPG